MQRMAKRLIDFIRNHPILSKLYVFFLGTRGFPTKWREIVARELDQYSVMNGSGGFLRKRTLYYDILYCTLVHGISPSEYFLYDFQKLSEKGRAEYMGDFMKDMLCTKIEDKNARKIFHDKALTYEYFRDYFHRDCIVVDKPEDWSAFSEFTKKHDKFLIKAVFESRGKSIYLVDRKLNEKTDRDLFDMIMKTGKCLVEEYIVQGAPLSNIHSESVNTVRFATAYIDGDVKLLFAELRMGCGDSFVDNAGAGGIVALIDIKSGIVSGIGCRENGERYIFHPDSNVKIVGTELPEWEALLKLVKELAAVVPQQKYVGWDLAYSQDGWVLVEGNHRAQMVGYQLCCGHGVRKEILGALKMRYNMY